MDTISPYELHSPKSKKKLASNVDIHVEYDRKDSSTTYTTASSPRMSPCSVDSGSPYLLRKASGDRRSVRPGAPSEPNEYNFNYHKRGLFLIINNKKFHPSTGQGSRDGTNVDAERLEERFQDLGFEVRRYDDVASSKMTKLMYDAAEYDHSDCDCFGCAILSHGMEGRIYATDGMMPLEVLTMPFTGERCPTLIGKPKLFFLQACRAARVDNAVDLTDSVSDRSAYSEDYDSGISPLRKIPVEADFLFSYSTVPDGLPDKWLGLRGGNVAAEERVYSSRTPYTLLNPTGGVDAKWGTGLQFRSKKNGDTVITHGEIIKTDLGLYKHCVLCWKTTGPKWNFFTC